MRQPPKFVSDAVTKEARLKLGTPLNKYQPEWPRAARARWMLCREFLSLDDPRLPPDTDKCWCSECGAYFNSTYAFDQHRVMPPHRRCLSFAQMRSLGWILSAKGHWRTPRKGSGRESRAQEGHSDAAVPAVYGLSEGGSPHEGGSAS